METLQGIFTPFVKLKRTDFAIMLALQLTLLLLIWTFGHYTFFPSPSDVWHAIISMNQEDNLIPEFMTSFTLCMKSMFFATIISCFFTYFSVIPIFRPISLFVTKFRFLTMVGLTFFFEMASSDTMLLKEELLTFAVTVFFTTGFISVISDIPGYVFDHARTLGLSPWQTLWEVVVRGKLADLFDMMRQNFAMAWMMITMVEGLERSGGGIGVLLLTKERTLGLQYIVALQIIVLLTGILMDLFIGFLTDQVCPYAKMNKR